MLKPLITKILPIAVLLVAPLSFADSAITKEMVDQLKAQPCFQKIDGGNFELLATKVKTARSDLQGMCQAGERDEAQEEGYDLADQFDDSKVLKQIAKCGDVGEQIADVFDIFIDTYGLGEEGEERVHVCDLF